MYFVGPCGIIQIYLNVLYGSSRKRCNSDLLAMYLMGHHSEFVSHLDKNIIQIFVGHLYKDTIQVYLQCVLQVIWTKASLTFTFSVFCGSSKQACF